MLTVLTLLACTPDTGDDTGVAAPPDPLEFAVDARGPYRAGFRDWEISYTLPTGAERTTRMNLWYPSNDSAGDEVTYSGVWPDATGALGNAELAASGRPDGTYPVMVYTHGDQAWGASSADLMSWFASHGWVAVAPDHTGNLLWDNVTPTPHEHWYHRPLDMSAVLDELENLPDGDALSGLADTSQVLVTGHSRGGYSVWALMGQTYSPSGLDAQCPDCTESERALFLAGFGDPRASAAVTLDGGIRRDWVGADGHLSAQGPVMWQSTDDDHEGRQATFDAMSGIDFTWVEVRDACHQTFATGACGSLDTAVGFAIVDTYALAMGRAHILGDADATVQGLLDGSVPTEGVTVVVGE